MLTIKDKKELLMKATANGKLYYTCVISNLKQRDDNSFKTVSNPYRVDRKPSLSVYRNKDYNIWLHNDLGDNNYHGDMFDFAAKRYGMDIKVHNPVKLTTSYRSKLTYLLAGKDHKSSYCFYQCA